MVEDAETTNARFIASNVSIQLMLKTVFEVIVTLAEDPERYRSDVRSELLDLADTVKLGPMPEGRERMVRGFVKEAVGNLLMNP
jgi:hypothetical protein